MITSHSSKSCTFSTSVCSIIGRLYNAGKDPDRSSLAPQSPHLAGMPTRRSYCCRVSFQPTARRLVPFAIQACLRHVTYYIHRALDRCQSVTDSDCCARCIRSCRCWAHVCRSRCEWRRSCGFRADTEQSCSELRPFPSPRKTTLSKSILQLSTNINFGANCNSFRHPLHATLRVRSVSGCNKWHACMRAIVSFYSVLTQNFFLSLFKAGK